MLSPPLASVTPQSSLPPAQWKSEFLCGQQNNPPNPGTFFFYSQFQENISERPRVLRFNPPKPARDDNGRKLGFAVSRPGGGLTVLVTPARRPPGPVGRSGRSRRGSHAGRRPWPVTVASTATPTATAHPHVLPSGRHTFRERQDPLASLAFGFHGPQVSTSDLGVRLYFA